MSIADLDMKLEVVVIPVSDVDRAKEFYSRLGWRLDADRAAGDNYRLVQFTPHGVDASQVFHCETGTACRFSGIGARVTGPHPERLSYCSFVFFSDPDSNGWLLQEVTKAACWARSRQHNVCIGARSCPGDDSRSEGP